MLIEAAALSAIAAGALLEHRHLQSITADPQHDLLSSPPLGSPLTVESADGTQLHAEVFGAAGAPTIVLIHGWTEILQYWTYVIDALREDFRVVAYDLRGHGGSGQAAGGDYSLARFGEDVEAVLAAAVPEGERAVVAGHSLGAMSIASWAEHHEVSARASGAALLFTGLGDLIANQSLFRLPQIAKRVTDPVGRRVFLGARTAVPNRSTPISHAAIRYFAFGPTATPALVAFYERMLVSCDIEVRAAAGLAMSEMELHHALARLTVPTLVMAGQRDRLTPPSHARRVAELLPDLIDLIVLPETGHMGPLERPAEVSAALRVLAERGSVAGGGAAARTAA
jgi:pimeloyl-ACP methyl ester carboxylesterase